MNQLADNIWTHETSHRFFGVPLGTRMTVVRLDDGGLWLHSPVELTDSLREEIDELGPVRHIVAPNRFHHVYVGDWTEAYPEATLWGAPRLPEKRTDLTFDHILSETPPWADQLAPQLIDGCSALNEYVFYHRASRTLITADLFMNVHEPESMTAKAYYWTNGVLGKPGLSRLIMLAFDDMEAAERSYEALLDWDIARIIVSHGDIVEQDAPETLRRVIGESF